MVGPVYADPSNQFPPTGHKTQLLHGHETNIISLFTLSQQHLKASKSIPQTTPP